MKDITCSTYRRLMTAWSSVALLVVSGCGLSTPDVELDRAPAEGVRAKMVADVARVVPGRPFHVGVLLTIPDGSHIYWRNPGASGLASGVEWTLSEGVEVGELQWPTPERFEVEGWDEVSFGYQSIVLLFAEVSVPASTTNVELLQIGARAYWLNCEEDGQCIPGDAELRLEIPVSSEAKSSAYVSLFEHYRQRVPVPLDTSIVPASIEPEPGASFTLRARDGVRLDFDGEAADPEFFPDEGEAWTIERAPGRGAESPESFRFAPPEDGNVMSGVLRFSVQREDSGTPETFYISIEE